MNSIDEAFSSVKQYCRKEGRISEAAMKLWIDIMKPEIGRASCRERV